MEKAAVFVDLDSLNVLYKIGGKFVAALTYSAGLDRLGETLPSLGAGFDVYLCLKPRAPGEGDLVIDELSITGLPFTVDSEELYQVLKFFRGYSGFGEVYLCNWVHNYIQMARVKTFKSVVYYGSRVAFMSVKDSTLEQFKVYQTQLEFEEQDGADYSGYGDVGLIDVDGFRAQYPEFAGGTKPQITAIAPLTQCYRTTVKMETDEFLAKLAASRASGVPLANTYSEREYKEPDTPDDPNLRPVERPEEEDGEQREVEDFDSDDVGAVRAKTPFVAVLFTLVSTIMAVMLGAFAGIVIKDPGVPDNTGYYNQVEQRVSAIQEMIGVYSGAPSFMYGVSEAWEYCNASQLPVKVSGFERLQDQFAVRYSCVSEGDNQLFVDYVGEKYTVASTNSLGAAEVDGGIVYQYSVTFG